MNAEMIALAQRVAESEHFRWQDRMSDILGETVLDTNKDRVFTVCDEYSPPEWSPAKWLSAPCITDDATAGCIYRQACTRWECDWIEIVRVSEDVVIWRAAKDQPATRCKAPGGKFNRIPGLCIWKQAAAEALAWKETTP